MESAHAAKTKELETKIETKKSETKELKTKVSTLSAQTSEQNKHKTHAAQLEEQRVTLASVPLCSSVALQAALEAKLKTEMEKASAKAADHDIKITELTSATKELRTKVSAAHSKEKAAAAEINNLKQTVASKPAQTSSVSNNPDDSTEVAKKVGSKMEGCTLVGDNAVNTTGFSIINKHNLAVMGKDIDSRTCVLRGVVKFTSDGSTATAWLDPNYRDPDTEMPFCSPVSGTMQFFASIVNPKDTSEIERTVGLQIEPHGRWIRIHILDVFTS